MKTIMVIGGGFAGVRVARDFLRRPIPDCEVLLISEESYTTYNPMLPEAVGAAVFPEHVVAPLREAIGVHRRGRFVMGRVVGLDAAAKTVTCRTLAGEMSFEYDHLVLTIGVRARLDLLPGMVEHALPLKTVGDAMHIRNTVLRRLARMELEHDPARRASLGHFIVLGGGFSGVEVAGAMTDCLKSMARYYRRVEPEHLKLTLLQGADRLLPEMHPALGDAALRSLVKRGVDVRLNARVISVGEDRVTLAGGETIVGETVVGTIGTQPNGLLQALNLPTANGRLRVTPELRVEGHDTIWAAGDCACIVADPGEKPHPATAQVAVQQGALISRNIAAAFAGTPARPFRYRHRGSMAAMGHLNGVAEVSGVPFSGFAAWIVWRAYYLMQMPTMGRKVRIFVEWAWGTFFPIDITHLRFTRSRDLKMPSLD
jgi:NADH dehydrogenase